MQSSMKVSFDAKLAASLSHEIDILSLPAVSRKRIFRHSGRAYLKASRDHIKQQRTVSGESMTKKKYGKGKALKRMGRDLKFFPGSQRVKLTWPNKGIARLAYRHQLGIPETYDAKRMEKVHGTPDYEQPASKKQAKALLQAGFRVKTPQRYKSGERKGRAKTKKPSQKWILENMTMGQAGAIIRVLHRTENPSRRWSIKVPERPFLGMTGGDAIQVLTGEITRERERRGSSA